MYATLFTVSLKARNWEPPEMKKTCSIIKDGKINNEKSKTKHDIQDFPVHKCNEIR